MNVWTEDLHETSQTNHNDKTKKLKIPPQNALDVIENIKIGIQEDLFITEDFYTEKSMLEFSNGRKIEDLGGRKNFFVIREIYAEGVSSFDFHKAFEEPKRKARLGIGFKFPRINIDFLMKAFGTFEEIADPYANSDPRHSPPLEKATHKYGNMATHHILKGNHSKTDIYAIISGDGSIIQLNFIQTEEQ